jgi:hypothetical protein
VADPTKVKSFPIFSDVAKRKKSGMQQDAFTVGLTITGR